MNIFLIIGAIAIVGGLVYWKRDWFKRNLKKVAFGTATVAMAASVISPTDRLIKINDIPDFLNVDGREISIQYTDDNSGENFIIKTDAEDYYGWGGSIIFYFSVSNVSTQNQNAQIVFSNNDVDVLGIQKFVKNDTTSIATTSGSVDVVSTTWQYVLLEEAKTPIGAVVRKDMKSSITENQFLTFINAGETQFFKGRLNIPNTVNGEEWFIEVIGSKNDYGHLDPTAWSDEIDFNSGTYSTGNLKTQNGWDVGSATFQVNTDNPLEGDQGVDSNGAQGVEVRKTNLTATDDGIVYVRYEHTSIGEDGAWFGLRSSVAFVLIATFRSGDIWLSDGATAVSEDSGLNYTANTPGVLKVIYDTATGNDFSIDYAEGGTYQGETAPNAVNDQGDITQVELGAKGGSQVHYADNITATDPTSVAAPNDNPTGIIIQQW